MSTAVEIERAIRRLPATELTQLREWFANYDAEQWDAQLESDIAAGRLDALAEQAISEVRNGLATDRRKR